MNGLQIFALIVLPIVVAAAGWVVAFIVAPAGPVSRLDDVAAGDRLHHL